MSSMTLLRMALMPLTSAVFWTFFFVQHKDGGDATERLLIRVPPWLSFLCGRPLPDHRVDLSSMLGQLGSLVSSLLWVPGIIFGVEIQWLVRIFVALLWMTVVVAFAARLAAIALARRRGGHRG